MMNDFKFLTMLMKFFADVLSSTLATAMKQLNTQN